LGGEAVTGGQGETRLKGRNEIEKNAKEGKN